MGDHFGTTLRYLREQAGYSLAELARLTNFDKSTIGHTESGVRRPTLALAEACDEAIGSTPLLAMLAPIGGDPVKRRALIENVGVLTAAGVGLGVAGLAEVVRQGLLADAGVPVDWEETVADYAREFVVAPSSEFGARLLSDMMLLRRTIREQGRSPELLRAAAGLSNFFGLWLGNQGDLTSASRQYRSAAILADHSGDTGLGDYIRGITAARGTYEGASVSRTQDTIDRVLTNADGRPTLGAFGAWLADVHLAGLMGDLGRGRAAVESMRRIAWRLPADADAWSAVGPAPRTEFLHAWIEMRCGTWADAQRAYERAVPALACQPMWLAEVELFLARAMVVAGYVDDGANHALAAARSLPHTSRVVGLAVRDVLSVLPAAYRRDTRQALEEFASSGPAPWETLA
jgi:transcriptional regulator with XRE-family HTH domain